MCVGWSRVALSDTCSLHTQPHHRSHITHHVSYLISQPYHEQQRNGKGAKTVRRNKVDKMEPTVFLQRLRLAASSRPLNILSVAAGQLPGRVRQQSSEAEGINKLREPTSALEHRVRTAPRQRRRRHRGPKPHLPQLPPSFWGRQRRPPPAANPQRAAGKSLWAPALLCLNAGLFLSLWLIKFCLCRTQSCSRLWT